MWLVHTYVGSSVSTVDSILLCFSQRLIYAALKLQGIVIIYCDKCVLVNQKDRKEHQHILYEGENTALFLSPSRLASIGKVALPVIYKGQWLNRI